MSKKTFRISMTILMAVIGILVFLNIKAEREKEPEYDKILPMANQNIVWTGAGYNGIYCEAVD